MCAPLHDCPPASNPPSLALPHQPHATHLPPPPPTRCQAKVDACEAQAGGLRGRVEGLSRELEAERKRGAQVGGRVGGRVRGWGGVWVDAGGAAAERLKTELAQQATVTRP